MEAPNKSAWSFDGSKVPPVTVVQELGGGRAAESRKLERVVGRVQIMTRSVKYVRPGNDGIYYNLIFDI